MIELINISSSTKQALCEGDFSLSYLTFSLAEAKNYVYSIRLSVRFLSSRDCAVTYH
jgi:hypothetical protein